MMLLRLLGQAWPALPGLVLAGCATPSTAPAPVAPTSPAVFTRAAVAADHPLASEAGAEMLRRGGNAVDAAVAASFTLSVVRPYSCGIGGGGFMVIHRPGEPGRPPLQVAINYRETAPAAVDPAYFTRLDEDPDEPPASRLGPHAAAVPGTVAGLLWALEHYGTMERAEVMAPAIAVAEEGFAADASFVDAADDTGLTIQRYPSALRRGRFVWEQLCRRGRLRVGDRITNPQQAAVLRRIAREGRRGFYEGPVAEAIVQAMADGGGPITMADLAGYRVRVTTPLRGSYRRWTVLSMPPPSSGGVAMQQTLAILERRADDLDRADRDGPRYAHLLVESMKHAFADRARWLADPDYVAVPVDELLDEAYLDELAARVDLEGPGEPLSYGTAPVPAEGGGTSHLSVLDASGMAVACTETVNLIYGSMVAVPGCGFVLNDQMDDFTTIPGRPNAFGLRQSDRNLPAPGKRPLSSMSPTIVLERDRAVIVAGGSGGPRIITGTLQCMLNSLVFDMTATEAVGAPRLHHQWLPDVVQFEDSWRDEATIEALQEMGHAVGRRDHVGVVQLIRVSPGGVEAASDPRKGGRAAGY